MIHEGKYYFCPPGAPNRPTSDEPPLNNAASALESSATAQDPGQQTTAPRRGRGSSARRSGSKYANTVRQISNDTVPGAQEATSNAHKKPEGDVAVNSMQETPRPARTLDSRLRELDKVEETLEYILIQDEKRRHSDSDLEKTNHKFFAEQPRALLAGADPVVESLPNSTIITPAELDTGLYKPRKDAVVTVEGRPKDGNLG